MDPRKISATYAPACTANANDPAQNELKTTIAVIPKYKNMSFVFRDHGDSGLEFVLGGIVGVGGACRSVCGGDFPRVHPVDRQGSDGGLAISGCFSLEIHAFGNTPPGVPAGYPSAGQSVHHRAQGLVVGSLPGCGRTVRYCPVCAGGEFHAL